MKRQFIHDLYSSFSLWVDHILLSQGEAYRNVSSSFYRTPDDKLRNFQVYGSPYKQWVYDSSITGAAIPSGVYMNNSFVPRGTNGLKLDFNNGRTIFTSGVPPTMVSGRFAAKDFGIYTTTKTDQELIFEQKIDFASQFPQSPSGIPADKIVAPAIFIRFTTAGNEPFALGGEYVTEVRARAVILSDTDYNLNGVGNIFADQKEKNFLVFGKTPLDEFGDLKGGYYNYNSYLSQYYDSNKLAYLEDVDFSKLTGGVNIQNPNLQVGFLDFTIHLPRFL